VAGDWVTRDHVPHKPQSLENWIPVQTGFGRWVGIEWAVPKGTVSFGSQPNFGCPNGSASSQEEAVADTAVDIPLRLYKYPTPLHDCFLHPFTPCPPPSWASTIASQDAWLELTGRDSAGCWWVSCYELVPAMLIILSSCVWQPHACPPWPLYVSWRYQTYLAWLIWNLVGSGSRRLGSIGNSSRGRSLSGGHWWVPLQILSNQCWRCPKIFYFLNRYCLLFALIGMCVVFPPVLENEC